MKTLGIAMLALLFAQAPAVGAPVAKANAVHHLYVSDGIGVVKYLLASDGLPSTTIDFTYAIPQQPVTIALDGRGYLYAGGYNRNGLGGYVYVLAPNGSLVRELDTAYAVGALAVDSEGYAYALEGNLGTTILVFAPGARGPAKPIATLNGASSGTYLRIGPDGRLYDVLAEGRVAVFDRPRRNAGAPSAYIVPPRDDLVFANALAFNARGSLFVSFYPKTIRDRWQDEDVDVIDFAPRRTDRFVLARDCYSFGNARFGRNQTSPGGIGGIVSFGEYTEISCSAANGSGVYVYHADAFGRQRRVMALQNAGGDMQLGP